MKNRRLLTEKLNHLLTFAMCGLFILFTNAAIAMTLPPSDSISPDPLVGFDLMDSNEKGVELEQEESSIKENVTLNLNQTRRSCI